MHFQGTVRLGLWLLSGLCLGVWARPQNPFEQLSLGAMNMAGNIAEAIQSGAAINRSMNFDTPLMSMHSKTLAGYGDAMRPPSNDDDSSEERRRRRDLHAVMHRVKREPCLMKMKTTTEAAADDDDVDARRRRAMKRAANNASRSRINQINKTKKKFQRRRRRQAGAGAGEAGPSFGDRIKGMWLAFVDNVVDAVQQVHQKIRSTTGQAMDMANDRAQP